MESWIGLGFAFITLLFTIGGFVGRYWKQQVDADMAKQAREFNDALGAAERAHAAKVDAISGGFRDSFQALREKISMVELYNEREFISKDTFATVIGKLEATLENINGKIDRIGERLGKA